MLTQYPLLAEWDSLDADTSMFRKLFCEPVGKVLEVGAHDEPLANELFELGYDVHGVDLREYDKKLPACNYTYTRSDFCNLPAEFIQEHQGTFDCVFSISAIEHFGLGTYSEGKRHAYYDVLAMRQMWHMLREGGVCYVTVPFGVSYVENVPHWRVYDYDSAYARLVQDFSVIFFFPFVSGPRVTCGGMGLAVGQILTPPAVSLLSGELPHVSLIMRLVKESVKRIAPDGR